MTQEQLALMLGVSRQSVTKWEAEKSYPEMDKLLKLCQIFDVTLDDLVQGDLTTSAPTPAVQARAAILREAAGGPPQDVCGYDEHMRTFAWKIAWGVFAILAGVALLMAWGGWAEASAPSLEAVGLIPLFAGIAIGLAFILTAAFQHTEFQRSHPFIQDFYTAEDRQRAQRLFAWLLVAGIVLIFTGIVALALTEATDDEIDRARARIERKRRKDQLASGLCAIIMIVATIAGLVMLFVPEYQTPYFWLAWAIGGLLCAVAAIAVGSFVKDQPSQ